MEENKRFRPYEKVANSIAVTKEIDPRLAGLWHLIGKKIICENIEEDSDDCKEIIEVFTTDAIAVKLLTKLSRFGYDIPEIKIEFLKFPDEHSMAFLEGLYNLSNDCGVVVKSQSNYIAAYDYGDKDSFIYAYIWSIKES